MKTSVIYIRVSSEEQAKGTSLTTQEADCRAWCQNNDYLVNAVYQDEETGKTCSRGAAGSRGSGVARGSGGAALSYFDNRHNDIRFARFSLAISATSRNATHTGVRGQATVADSF